MHLAGRIGINALLVVVSLALFFGGMELFVRVTDMRVSATPTPPALPAVADRFADIPTEIRARAQARFSFLTMPDDWKRRAVEVPGAAVAFYWHDALQVQNADAMRHIGPYPAHRPGVIRVIVVGDSLTYGYAIPQEATFTHLLSEWMSSDGRIEFLNLGVPGFQSEDVAKVIDRAIPELAPDLIIYGVCENDFLPSGVGQYELTYAIPIPENIKAFLLSHSRALEFTSDLYDAALRRFHIRRDFFDDILADFDGYQQRFDRDVRRMALHAKQADLPPIISIVLDQYPQYNGRGYRIARIAESIMRRTGFDVIETEDYYRTYNGDNLYVSPWEGHPNEVANYIWARMLLARLRSRLPATIAITQGADSIPR